jgi:hypothetical protein
MCLVELTSCDSRNPFRERFEGSNDSGCSRHCGFLIGRWGGFKCHGSFSGECVGSVKR